MEFFDLKPIASHISSYDGAKPRSLKLRRIKASIAVAFGVSPIPAIKRPHKILWQT